MLLSPAYPTAAHERAAQAIVAFFAPPERGGVDAVLLTNSCARGRATPDSCLDIVVLLPEESPPVRKLLREWQRFHETEPVFAALRATSAFSVVHLDFFDGRFRADRHPDDEFPDAFEVELGNYLVYAVPLWERDEGGVGGSRWERLRGRWLPYYDEERRRERLALVRDCCHDSLARIPLYVERGLFFAAFDRLYRAFQMFLQAVFIARRTYPLAYNKWIREQVEGLLGLPELYAQLPALLEIAPFESAAVLDKGRTLRALLDCYATE